MPARSKARKRAVDVLYEADLRGADPVATLAERVARADPPVRDYTIELVEGTAARLGFIDQVLDEYAHGWTVGRLPDVDRAVLRLAVFELLYRDDVPAAVVIDEAVELARMLSTDDSPSFVNGVLGRVHRDGPPASAGDLPPAGDLSRSASADDEPEDEAEDQSDDDGTGTVDDDGFFDPGPGPATDPAASGDAASVTRPA